MLEPAGGRRYTALREEFAPAVRRGRRRRRRPLCGIRARSAPSTRSGGKTRKVHHVILLPGLDEAEELAHRLEAVGNLHSDGRPILGMDSRDLLQMTHGRLPGRDLYSGPYLDAPFFCCSGNFPNFPRWRNATAT